MDHHGPVPLLGQAEEAARAGILHAVRALSMQIYCQLASAHVGTRDRPHQEVDADLLRQLARDSQSAAEAYFEGIGVAQFQQVDQQ